MIEGHGDDTYVYSGKIKHNFSSNILQGQDLSAIKKLLSTHLDSIANYPEPTHHAIEPLLAQKLCLLPENVVMTNGATDAIYLIARTFLGFESAILQPTFAEYADACRLANHRIRSFMSISQLDATADIIWICNPNNPTGSTYDVNRLRAAIAENPEKIFVIDQAYHAYTRQPVLTPKDVLDLPNLILLYSMTKDYAIPGLRLGYLVASKNIAEKIRRNIIPWSLNALAVEAAKFLLSNDIPTINADYSYPEVARISTALQDLGIEVLPSTTNFMLCRLPKGSAHDLKDFLATNYGILIRDASNFEGLTAQHFRIAVQDQNANNLLLTAICGWMR